MPELYQLGKHRILEEIGHGAFSTAHRMHDARLSL